MTHSPLKQLTLFIALSFPFLFAVAVQENDVKHVWIAAAKGGIYVADLHLKSGKIDKLRPVQQGVDASYIVKHPTLAVLYATVSAASGNTLNSYNIQADGNLTLQSALAQRPGRGTHLNVSPNGDYVALAYYGAGMAGIYNLSTQGAIQSVFDEVKYSGRSVNPDRQTQAHPHWVGLSPDSRFLYVADLGSDRIWVHAINKTKSKLTLLQKVAAPTGAGPRHMAFHPTLNFVYVSNELTASVSRYTRNPEDGKLTYLDSKISAKEASKEFWHNVSDIRVHPSGDFLYLLNRGFDQVSVFRIQHGNGKLEPVEREPIRGSISRNIAFDRSGRWALVAGVASNTLAVFDTDLATGELRFTRQVLAIPTPMSIVIE